MSDDVESSAQIALKQLKAKAVAEGRADVNEYQRQQEREQRDIRTTEQRRQQAAEAEENRRRNEAERLTREQERQTRESEKRKEKILREMAEEAARETKRGNIARAKEERERIARQKKEDAEEDRRRKKIEQVERNIESARIKQEDAEKAREFKEMAKRSATKPAYKEMRPITPATIKESVRKSVSKAPAVADRAITGTFGGVAQSLIASPKTSFKKAYTSETKELSATAKQFVKSQAPAKKKTYVTPKVRPGGLAINPAFVDNLIGISGPSKTQPAPRKSLSNVTSSLDRFARLI